MIGKSFEKVLYVVCIGVLHHLAVLGCQRNRDCHTTEPHGRQKCCHKTLPPRCMDKVLCHYYGNDNTKLTTTYPKFTDPDYDTFNFPDFNKFTVPHIDRPTFSYNDYDSTDNSSRWIGGGSAVVVFLVLSIFIIGCRLIQNSPSQNHFRQNCNVQPPPSAIDTSRTNLIAQQNEEPRRMVILAMTREEDHISRENFPQDDERPFVSEENIPHNLHSNCAQEPPPYEEIASEPLLSNYEDYVNAAMDQPSSPVYPEVHTTSRSSINPSQITPPIQQNLPKTNVNPPSCEEAQAADNQAIQPLP